MITGWRYYWRRYLFWFPVQWCCVCGRGYWGGFPTLTWLPYYKDYCSQACADEELEWLDSTRQE